MGVVDGGPLELTSFPSFGLVRATCFQTCAAPQPLEDTTTPTPLFERAKAPATDFPKGQNYTNGSPTDARQLLNPLALGQDGASIARRVRLAAPPPSPLIPLPFPTPPSPKQQRQPIAILQLVGNRIGVCALMH